jgi:6-phosphogluconolactonase
LTGGGGIMLRLSTVALIATIVVGLSACGGGGGSGGSTAPPVTYTVGATVSGLSGTGLILSNSGTDPLSVSANGAVTFAKPVAAGSTYSVTVTTQPSSPTQTCTVTGGSGTVSSGNVMGVSVACTTNSYSVQPTVSGLTGSGLVVQNNFSDDLAIAQPGPATFATQVPSGGSYSLSVLTQPSNPVQTCTIGNASGTVTNAAVTAPAVTCVTQSPWSLVTVNYGDNSLSLFTLDPATGQPRARGAFGVGFSPTDINGDGLGRFLYVLNAGAATISAFQIDLTASTLRPIANGTVPTGSGSVSLTGYPSAKALYAVNNGSNDITAYAIDQTTGVLSAVSGGPFKAGTAPQKLALDAAGRFAYVTNAGSNDIYTYSVDATTGALTEIPNSRVATGTRPFEVLLDRTGKFAYVANTGSASISAYAVDAATGVLTPIAGSPFATSGVPGDVTAFNGGRAPMSLHPNGKLLFVRSTVGKTLSVFTIDPTSGALTAVTGSPYTVGDGAVTHALDPSGRFLFVANRGTVQGPGSISAFKVDMTSGALAEVSGSPFALSGGPSWVTPDPSGKFLYAASTATDLVYSLSIDQSTGALAALGTGARVLTGDYPLVALALPSAAQPGSAATFKSKFAYVPNSDNSISGYTVDTTTGTLAPVPSSPVQSTGTGLAAVAVAADSKRVYAVNTGSNTLSPFDIDQTTGKLTAEFNLVGVNAGPTLLAFDAAGQNAYVVSGGTNTMIAYPVDSTTGMFNSGGGVNFAPGPAPTAIAVADSGRFVFGIRDGLIESYLTRLGSVSTPLLGAPTASANASSIAVHPNGLVVYVTNADASGTIQTFSVASQGLQAGALSGGPSTATGSMPASVAIDPTGHFLYTANAGSNDISGFSVDPVTGALTPFAGGPVGTGHHPISVTIDYSGKFLYAVSDVDASVLTYTIDSGSGALTAAGAAVATGPTPKGFAISRDVEVH